MRPLEARLAPLARLPRGLWLQSLVNSNGALETRLAALEILRQHLLRGSLPAPAEWDWPAGHAAAPARASIEELGLAGYCREQPELTDLILRSLLWHLDQIPDYLDRGANECDAARIAVKAFHADWSERQGELDELIYVLGDLGDMLKNSRWDEMRGLLSNPGWREVLRIRKLIEQLPELVALIRKLGRNRQTEQDDDTHRVERIIEEQTLAPHPSRRSVRVPDLPGETRGIKRSGRVGRMLPSEAALLLHPRLRLIWHARHVERALLTYDEQDHYEETRLVPAPAWRPTTRREPQKRLQRGPILLCVDTSGSMQGGAEAVAKAVVLEAMRCAHKEGRACHLFAFGGPGELLEQELNAAAEGLQAMTEFLGQSFGGGTDICGPLARAMAKLHEEQWRAADLLIASDGEFGATADLAARLQAAKDELGLYVQGILIGDRETIGMLELADHVHWVEQWRRYGSGPAGPPPVHSKSLTAQYFPGALRGPVAAAQVDGASAAAAVSRGEGAAKSPK
ncbi:MAG: VWA domain-containing protein [Rhodocyclaceae bacterium]|nr:VWA domain-containing protein [Rhodocyclaceae bacterium]MBX3666957.1 VWA domain-containing protein [Rhodocyclaceae bacterium]